MYARSFGSDGWLITHRVGSDTRMLTYDAASRITQTTDTNPVTNRSYDYDALDRLINQSDNTGFKLWGYDANSNRTTAQFGGTGYPYTSTSNRLTSAAGPVAKNYSYDAAGNPLSDGATTFTWNAAGKLATTVNNAKTHTYKTNALDQRISKNGPLSSKFFFFYDPAGQLIGEYRDNSSTATPADDWLVRQETIWLEDIPVAVIRKASATSPIQVYFIHADHLNTPRVIVNQSNTPVWRWENTHAFGANLPNEDPDGNGQLFEYHPRFPGQYFDKETNLHYNYFRYYEPETGRYISPDPIGLAGGINVYNYVEVNPILFVDPFGLRVLNPRNYSVSSEVMEALWTFNSQVGCDKDIVVTGGDRASNSKYGAGSRSTHVQGIAADISTPGQSHLETANQASESGLFGGVGWYEEGYRGPNGEGPHTHVDLRKNKARWGHPAKGSSMRGFFPPYEVKLNRNNCLCAKN